MPAPVTHLHPPARPQTLVPCPVNGRTFIEFLPELFDEPLYESTPVGDWCPGGSIPVGTACGGGTPVYEPRTGCPDLTKPLGAGPNEATGKVLLPAIRTPFVPRITGEYEAVEPLPILLPLLSPDVSA